ncbi:8193_t:CDS:2 [Racocetra persica]|uniref:8193_t:CDS:1 n=1 Tax=Racocetra persica TaxID=160502 RepID=A0ACA9MKG4_9GLOM|nr:8193_t:CDS:2 [Racocetra persica]
MEKAIDKITDLEIVPNKAMDKTTDKATDVVINKATNLVMDMRMDSISETINEATISDDDTKLEIGYKLIIKTSEGMVPNPNDIQNIRLFLIIVSL